MHLLLKGSKFKRLLPRRILIFEAASLHDLFIERFLEFFYLHTHIHLG